MTHSTPLDLIRQAEALAHDCFALGFSEGRNESRAECITALTQAQAFMEKVHTDHPTEAYLGSEYKAVMDALYGPGPGDAWQYPTRRESE